VRDGLTPPRNSGVAEAAVDKIKMIKRQMYSRARLPLCSALVAT
jgi:transposase